MLRDKVEQLTAELLEKADREKEMRRQKDELAKHVSVLQAALEAKSEELKQKTLAMQILTAKNPQLSGQTSTLARSKPMDDRSGNQSSTQPHQDTTDREFVRHKKHGDYTVAIICAIWFEMSAVRYMLDSEHPHLPILGGDVNRYILGELSGHNVAIAWLPGNQGVGSAAIVATNMARTFPCIKWRFLVGIGGGVPSEAHDIRLGDVVISMPEGQFGGVVQYDLGRDTEDGFHRKGFLSPPPSELRSAAEIMRSDHLVKDNQVDGLVLAMLRSKPRLSEYKRPPPGSDLLFQPDYHHAHQSRTCKDCDKRRIVDRLPRGSESSKIHYGLVASGGKVMKSAVKRIQATRELGDILCFEMEAAGIATEFACIVIRGISDYADSHKNDSWQRYAAAAAAAATKELLSYVQPSL